MGYSISWIAVKDRKLAQIAEQLRLTDSGKIEEFPVSDISGADLLNGWCHFQFNELDSGLISKEILSSISLNTTVVCCQVEEHVMFSKSSCWDNGGIIWSVEHDAQNELYHINAIGSTPVEFLEIRDKLFEEQKQEGTEVDFVFEIPLVLAQKFTGYKHDECASEHEGLEYKVFTSSAISQNKPWWRFW